MCLVVHMTAITDQNYSSHGTNSFREEHSWKITLPSLALSRILLFFFFFGIESSVLKSIDLEKWPQSLSTGKRVYKEKGLSDSEYPGRWGILKLDPGLRLKDHFYPGEAWYAMPASPTLVPMIPSNNNSSRQGTEPNQTEFYFFSEIK